MEKLVKELMSLGLTSQEAQIYVFFAQNNSDKKKEVMSQLEIEEQELMDNLQGLAKKGFVKTSLKNSNVFSVVPLEIVMERIIREKLGEAQEIREAIRDNKLP